MNHICTANPFRSIDMKALSFLSPISLRYIAALRGNKPKKTGCEFTYAEMGCADAQSLICLAASNPEGRFYGIVQDDATRSRAEEQASQRGTFNVIFLTGTPADVLARIENGSALPPMLDYLVCDETETSLSAADHAALFDLAEKRLNPSGIFVTRYRAYDRDDGSLRFLIQELAPEMGDSQKHDFLKEIKQLGSSYLSKHPDIEAKLDAAIVQNAPQTFFDLFQDGKANSGTFDTLVAASAKGFSFAGDAVLDLNFVELSIPQQAQDLIVSCRTSPFYEAIKDFALNRSTRADIWIHAPFDLSANPADLYGGFAYGTVLSREDIPSVYMTNGKTIDLSGSVYDKVINLMSIMPVGVGDMLAHPDTCDEQPEKILEALQLLVACGFAMPMRGMISEINSGSIAQPRFVGSYNRFLDKEDLSESEVLFASQVAGFGVTLPAREAFVMQALNRAGLVNSVSALMPELRRIANTPASMTIMNADEPTDELAHLMVLEVVGKSLPKWYAYALLEAA